MAFNTQPMIDMYLNCIINMTVLGKLRVNCKCRDQTNLTNLNPPHFHYAFQLPCLAETDRPNHRKTFQEDTIFAK